jgi:Tol biopolymer transport system component
MQSIRKPKLFFGLLIILTLVVILSVFFLKQRFFSSSSSSKVTSFSDICVDWVRPIAIGHTKPFSPWSPDGEWLTYSNLQFPEGDDKVKIDEPRGIYVIRYDGTGKRLVAPDGFRPSFGRFQWQIVYGKAGTTGKPGYKDMPEEDIWIVNFDGSGNRPLLADEEDGKGGGVGMVNIDGTKKRFLVINSGVWGYSQDGKKVFVQSVDKVKKGYVVGGWLDIKEVGIDTEADSANKVNWLTAIKYPENHYGHPQVNFEGTMVTYDSPSANYPLEKRNIWVGFLDGSNKNDKVTDYGDSGSFANHPRWSPDGQWLVYDEQSFGEKGVKDKVTVVNIKTREKKEIYGLLVPQHSGWTEPGWSPDGKKIVFYGPDPNNENRPSIWVVVLKECG